MNQYNVGDACPSCANGKLERKVIEETFQYKGQKLAITDYPVFHCSNCGEEFVEEQTLDNVEKRVRDFQRGVDGLLTSDEIVQIRKKLRLTQRQLADKLYVSRPTIARYESGQLTQSKSQDIHIRLLIENPTCLSFVETGKTQWAVKMMGGTILYNPSIGVHYQPTIKTTNRLLIQTEDYNDGKTPIALAA